MVNQLKDWFHNLRTLGKLVLQPMTPAMSLLSIPRRLMPTNGRCHTHLWPSHLVHNGCLRTHMLCLHSETQPHWSRHLSQTGPTRFSWEFETWSRHRTWESPKLSCTIVNSLRSWDIVTMFKIWQPSCHHKETRLRTQANTRGQYLPCAESSRPALDPSPPKQLISPFSKIPQYLSNAFFLFGLGFLVFFCFALFWFILFCFGFVCLFLLNLAF